MGHEIHHSVYNEKVNKKAVQAEWDDYAAKEDWQEGCSGLPSNIRWIDYVCENYDEAYEYIEKHDKGWYDQIAVKFKDYGKLELSKTYETLKERAERLHARYIELENNIHYKDVKSAFITCRSCESKLSSKFFGKTIKNICPVCYNDLRPQSTLDIIAKSLENAKKAEKDLKQEEKKLQKKQEKKAQIKWLVKIEFHV